CAATAFLRDLVQRSRTLAGRAASTSQASTGTLRGLCLPGYLQWQYAHSGRKKHGQCMGGRSGLLSQRSGNHCLNALKAITQNHCYSATDLEPLPCPLEPQTAASTPNKSAGVQGKRVRNQNTATFKCQPGQA